MACVPQEIKVTIASDDEATAGDNSADLGELGKQALAGLAAELYNAHCSWSWSVSGVSAACGWDELTPGAQEPYHRAAEELHRQCGVIRDANMQAIQREGDWQRGRPVTRA